MGRHGGGSRSGGRSSGGGSRGGGSSSRSSSMPFHGSYNRSYYDRRGRHHSYYTTDPYFGSQRGFGFGTLFALLFLIVHMCFMLSGIGGSVVSVGGKVSGDISRIKIVDNAELLSHSEEKEVFELFNEVYKKSGMPITLYTTDFSWKTNYRLIEAYSEELYYSMGTDEDAMIILFTTEDINGFHDWEYDMYCGDDTIKCLLDNTFEVLLNLFQKCLYSKSLAESLITSWHSVMDDLAKTSVNYDLFPALLFLVLFYGFFFVTLIGKALKKETAYRYFKEHPEELSLRNTEGYYS